MSIPIRRATKLFEESGFVLDWAWYGSLGFTRRPAIAPVFEWIEISRAGRRLESVACRIYCSLVSARLLNRGLFKDLFVREVAELPETGTTIIKSSSHAMEWVSHVIEVAIPKFPSLVRSAAPQLLETTSGARSAVQRYAERIRAVGERSQWFDGMKRLASVEVVEKAVRLAHAAGVVRLRSGAFMFEAACLGLVLFERDVESSERIGRLPPIDDLDCMHRILLLVQRLYADDDEFWKAYRVINPFRD